MAPPYSGRGRMEKIPVQDSEFEVCFEMEKGIKQQGFEVYKNLLKTSSVQGVI